MMLRRATLARYNLVSISRRAHPMQRDYRAPIQNAQRTVNRPHDSATACGPERVRAPEWCGGRNFGDSNARSELLATTATEARTFQRNRERGNGRLPARHIRGSGIPRKIGSMRDQ